MTKKQRKIIYWAAMFEIEAFGLRGAGICWAIYQVLGCKYYVGLEALPELVAQKPKRANCDGFWFFPGEHQQERLECLSRAIDLCEE